MAESILACSACLRRAIQLLPHQKAVLERRTVHNALLARPFIQGPRRFASAAKPAAALTTNDNDSNPTAEVDSAEYQKKLREKRVRAVNKELEYADDPWKIGQLVESSLKKDRYEEALLMTQKASKDHQVVVSWNHLISYKLEKQELRAAIKLYNDMKKRAQLPNVQTFTIIFRGCARSEHPKLAVSEAIRLYNILMRDSRIQPNSTHMNAVLNVCGRAGDLDSMFTILDTVNDSTRAPTAYTYTAVLNALRYSALKETKDLDKELQAKNMDKMVQRSKALWEEVMDKWRKGRLVVDEELVCAMGRSLAASSNREHHKDVFELLHQTMGIPNLVKSNAEIPADGSKSVVQSKKAIYAAPGKNTLALISMVLAKARLTTFGIKYWNLLIREYQVVPDMDNWMRMFGLLKVAKASAHASDILGIVPDEYINYKMYRIAMETCVRDNINQNAVKNSNRILDSMMQRLKIPDPHTMRLYLRVSLVSHYFFREKAQGGDHAGAKQEYGVQITEALDRLWGPYRKLHSHYFEQVKPKNKEEESILFNDKREVIALARIMYSSFSKVIEERMLPEEKLRELRQIGGRINKEIGKFFKDREELEPNLNPKTKAKHDMPDFDYKPSGDFVWDTNSKRENLSETREKRQEQRNFEFQESGDRFSSEHRNQRRGRPTRERRSEPGQYRRSARGPEGTRS